MARMGLVAVDPPLSLDWRLYERSQSFRHGRVSLDRYDHPGSFREFSWNGLIGDRSIPVAATDGLCIVALLG